MREPSISIQQIGYELSIAAQKVYDLLITFYFILFLKFFLAHLLTVLNLQLNAVSSILINLLF